MKSKLEGSAYTHCPLCGVSTNIEHAQLLAQSEIDKLYQTLFDRNELIDKLSKEIARLNAEKFEEHK